MRDVKFNTSALQYCCEKPSSSIGWLVGCCHRCYCCCCCKSIPPYNVFFCGLGGSEPRTDSKEDEAWLEQKLKSAQQSEFRHSPWLLMFSASDMRSHCEAFFYSKRIRSRVAAERIRLCTAQRIHCVGRSPPHLFCLSTNVVINGADKHALIFRNNNDT